MLLSSDSCDVRISRVVKFTRKLWLCKTAMPMPRSKNIQKPKMIQPPKAEKIRKPLIFYRKFDEIWPVSSVEKGLKSADDPDPSWSISRAQEMWSVIVRDENARCTDACWIIPFVICLGLFIFVCSDAGTSAVKLRVPRAADFVCKLLGVEMKMNHMSRDVTRDSRMMISYNSCYDFFFLIRLNLHWNTQWSQNVRISELRRLVFILMLLSEWRFWVFPP